MSTIAPLDIQGWEAICRPGVKLSYLIYFLSANINPLDAAMYNIVGSIGGFIGFGFPGLFFGAVIPVIARALLIDWLDDAMLSETLGADPADLYCDTCWLSWCDSSVVIAMICSDCIAIVTTIYIP